MTFYRGDRVRIKKGALITSTGPAKSRTAARPYVVTVHDYQAHHKYRSYHDEEVVIEEHITWVGKGGYWHKTAIENVEPYNALLDGRGVILQGRKCHRKNCSASWTCRRCERKFCEHFCSLKDPQARIATCGKCQLQSVTTKAPQ